MHGALSSPLRNLAGGIFFMLVVALVATAAYVAPGWSVGDAASRSSRLRQKSNAVGLSISDIERLAGGAFLIVALQRPGKTTLVQPPTSALVNAGDGVAVVGRPIRAAAMQAIFRQPRSDIASSQRCCGPISRAPAALDR